jgi:hypothetical protein
MDFNQSSKRLEAEQAKRRQEAKRKLDKEKIAIAQQKKWELEEALLRAEKQKVELQRAEEERILKEQELILTGGISFEESYDAACNEELEEDRICLPESALMNLSNQDAISKGVILFSISRLDSEGHVVRTTHCGVREFSAPENTVVLSVIKIFLS